MGSNTLVDRSHREGKKDDLVLGEGRLMSKPVQITKPYMLVAEDMETQLDAMVETTFEDLVSQFMLLPRGSSFVPFETFGDGYEQLRINTNGFANLSVERVWDACRAHAVSWLALRAILG